MLEFLRRGSTPPDSLLAIIAEVRSRWRLKLALRGLLRMALVAVALFAIAAYGMEWARFTTASIIVARVALVLAMLGSIAWFLVRPLRQRVTDEQVALYLEENEPALQATLLSAVEASRAGKPESEALVRRVVEQAIQQCAELDSARKVERLPLRRNGVALIALAAVTVGALVVGPAFFRTAMWAILQVSSDVQAAVPYHIDVKPGNATIPKGADQTISAKLSGFTSEDVVVMARRSP